MHQDTFGHWQKIKNKLKKIIKTTKTCNVSRIRNVNQSSIDKSWMDSGLNGRSIAHEMLVQLCFVFDIIALKTETRSAAARCQLLSSNWLCWQSAITYSKDILFYPNLHLYFFICLVFSLLLNVFHNKSLQILFIIWENYQYLHLNILKDILFHSKSCLPESIKLQT